jgi:polyhydroxybutyrate depolymerase
MKYIFVLLFSILAMASYAQSRQISEDMLVDGIKRSFVTYIPANDDKEQMPLVISLHGGFASPKGQFHLADFRPIADRDKFMVLCPASKHFWHDGRNNHGIDDIKFTAKLIDYMIAKYHADPQRVYVTGISNGGFMTSRIACQLHNRVAAIAVVAATLDEDEGYTPEKPMPVMYMHGTDDPIIPENGNGGKKFGRRMYSQDQVLKLWAELDKCDPQPTLTDLPEKVNDGTSVTKKEYINHATGFKVVGYTIINGGHTWPGGWQYLPKLIVGKTTQNLNACEVIWDFFKQYRLQNYPTMSSR